MPDQQSLAAVAALTEYDRPIEIDFVDKARSWQDRQKIQYQAMKGLMYKDFHGLKDFTEQMDLFTNSSATLKVPWLGVKPMVPIQHNLFETLMEIPELGLVGEWLASLLGITSFAKDPADILTDQDPSTI